MHKLPRTKLTLDKRTATLRTLLVQNASEHKLLRAAARVRDARIHVLRAKLGELPPMTFAPEQQRRAARLRKQIESLQATTPMDVLAEFRLARPEPTSDAQPQSG